MKFFKIAHIHWTDFKTRDISFGIHICWAGRIDFHIGTGMLSIGNVPLYKDNKKSIFAVSNSFHNTRKLPIRAGTP